MTMPTLPAGHVPTAAELEEITDLIDGPPRFVGRQTVAQVVTTATFTAITFGSEDVDNYNGHSTAALTSRYVCQLAGWYQVSGKVAWNGSATGRRGSDWRVNGAIVGGSQVIYAAGSASAVQLPAATMEVFLSAADYVELFGYHEHGSNLSTDVSFSGVHSFMSVRWVGAA